MRTSLLAVLLLTGACAAPDTNLVACPPQGCAALDPPSPREQALLDHAAFDLQCGQQNLHVSYCDRNDVSALVAGCGRQARYTSVGRYGESVWVLDSPVFV